MACFWTDLKNTACIEIAAAGNPNFKGTGLNDQGQLGLGHTSAVNTFTPIPLDNVVKMSMGYKFAMAIDSAGILYGTGLNDKNQLTSALPSSVSTFTPIGTDFLEIQCGFGCAIGVKTNGDVMRVGQGIDNGNSFGAATIDLFNNPVFTNFNGIPLAGNSTDEQRLPSSYSLPLAPGFILEFTNKAEYPLVFLTDTNSSGGGLGGGLGGGSGEVPGKIGFDLSARDGSIIQDNLFFSSSNKVFRYVERSNNSVGIADFNDPLLVSDGVTIDNNTFDPPSGSIIYSADDGIFIVTPSSDLYVHGANLKGELGIAGTNISTFTLVGSGYDRIVPAPFTTFALKTDGNWYVVGRNIHGNMGVGDNFDKTDFFNIGAFTEVSAHNSDTLVLV